MREAFGYLVPHGQADDYGGERIERIDIATGHVETLYSEAVNALLRAPNDIVFDAHGGFWYADHGRTRVRERDVTGVFYATADGTGCREVIFPLENPTGIGLSPDGNTLYVSETFTRSLWAFDIVGPGQVAGGGPPGGSRGAIPVCSRRLRIL